MSSNAIYVNESFAIKSVDDEINKVVNAKIDCELDWVYSDNVEQDAKIVEVDVLRRNIRPKSSRGFRWETLGSKKMFANTIFCAKDLHKVCME